ncbi:MAG: HAD family hydrolase [Thermodesulfobacteriota bacterium]
MKSSFIQVIFFDLGNVILPFDNYPIAEKLCRFSQKTEFQDPKKIFSYLFDPEDGVINDFDKGKMSPSEFFQSIREHLGLSITYEQFIPVWTEIFTENQDVSEIIRSLKRRWRLGLLSNTDPLHFNHIVSTFPIVSVLEKWILSYEVGFKKPDTRIFQIAIEWASVEPENILLIDDTKGHVEAAGSLGMQGIHFISANQLRKELNDRLKIDLS